ncbi:MAG: ATP-binding protein [Planctomycetota bacterium]
MEGTSGGRGISLGRDAIGSTVITGDGNIVVVQASGRINEAPQESTPKAAIGPNPYKGLLAFDAQDANHFFGRETQVNRLWEQFRDLHDPLRDGETRPRLLSVLGPSGSGKSSVVRAGLIPELARRPLGGSKKARVAVLTPGAHPLESLAAVLARLATDDPPPFIAKEEAYRTSLQTRGDDGEAEGLRRSAASLPQIKSTPLLLLIDQFEEIYSLCDKHEVRCAFIDNILNAVSAPGSNVSAIITLRSDFLGETQEHSTLNSAIAAQSVIIPAMNETELRSAITEPAKLAGHPLDRPTVDLLINETEDREGVLPLLQFALTRIWEGLHDGTQPAETLNAIGGVGGALAGEAQRIYGDLAEADQKIARRVFLGLVQLGEGTGDTRRRCRTDDLLASGEERPKLEAVVQRFAHRDVRLITLSASPDGTELAEVTHEALFRHWRELKRWLNESRDDLRLQRQLDQDAQQWDSLGRDAGTLWRSPRLDLLKSFVERASDDMTHLQMDFWRASNRAEQRRRWIAIATAVGAVVVFVAVVFLASWGWKNARENQQLVEARDLELRAAGFLAVLDGNQQPPSEEEHTALKKLSVSPRDVRLDVVRQLVDPEGEVANANATRLQTRLPYIIHAIVGLDVDFREEVKEVVATSYAADSTTDAIKQTRAIIGAYLQVDDPELNHAIEADFIELMTKSVEDPEHLAFLCNQFCEMRAKASKQSLNSAASIFIDQIVSIPIITDANDYATRQANEHDSKTLVPREQISVA